MRPRVGGGRSKGRLPGLGHPLGMTASDSNRLDLDVTMTRGLVHLDVNWRLDGGSVRPELAATRHQSSYLQHNIFQDDEVLGF